MRSLFILTLLPLASLAQDTSCYLSGSCIEDSDVNTITDTPEECQIACQNNAEICEFWTFNPNNNFCTLYYPTCTVDSSQCPECTSGPRECPTAGDVCGQPYQCDGAIVNAINTSTDSDCKTACLNDSANCAYYTFYLNSAICLTWRTCELQTSAVCDGCTTSQPTCV